MPKPYPKEFRDDVVRVARARAAGVTLVHEITLSTWLRKVDVDDGHKPGTTTSESAELRDWKRRNRLLEQDEVGYVGES